MKTNKNNPDIAGVPCELPNKDLLLAGLQTAAGPAGKEKGGAAFTIITRAELEQRAIAAGKGTTPSPALLDHIQQAYQEALTEALIERAVRELKKKRKKTSPPVHLSAIFVEDYRAMITAAGHVASDDLLQAVLKVHESILTPQFFAQEIYDFYCAGIAAKKNLGKVTPTEATPPNGQPPALPLSSSAPSDGARQPGAGTSQNEVRVAGAGGAVSGSKVTAPPTQTSLVASATKQHGAYGEAAEAAKTVDPAQSKPNPKVPLKGDDAAMKTQNSDARSGAPQGSGMPAEARGEGLSQGGVA